VCAFVSAATDIHQISVSRPGDVRSSASSRTSSCNSILQTKNRHEPSQLQSGIVTLSHGLRVRIVPAGLEQVEPAPRLSFRFWNQQMQGLTKDEQDRRDTRTLENQESVRCVIFTPRCRSYSCGTNVGVVRRHKIRVVQSAPRWTLLDVVGLRSCWL